MQEKDSVAVYFVQAALQGLAEQPRQVAGVLAEAGIDPQLLTDNTARVAASAFAKLWLAVARELNDEFQFVVFENGILQITLNKVKPAVPEVRKVTIK